MDHYKIEALWDCIYCGRKGIRGRFQDCPHCGNPRGREVSFYLPNDISVKNAVDQGDASIDRGPDWMCEYCQRYSPATLSECRHCGAKRHEGSSDYFRIQRERSGSDSERE